MFSQLRRFIRGLQAAEKHDLSYIFAQADPAAPLADKVDWVASLAEWIRTTRGGATPATRLRFILQWLERHPAERQRSAEVLRAILRETAHTRLYTDVGVPTEPTFGREFRHRLLTVFAPEYDDPGDLAGVQARVFYDDDDADWLETIPDAVMPEVLSWLRDGLATGDGLAPGWSDDVLEAARILAARALAVTLRPDFIRRSPGFRLREHPLARLGLHLQSLEGPESPRDPQVFEALRADLADARRLLIEVRSVLEQTGVSVEIVYQLDRVRNDLIRVSRLVGLLERDARGDDLTAYFTAFWCELVRGHQRDSDFSDVFLRHIGLLSKKIVERTGASGEHYITQTRGQYGGMLALAAGGGIVTAFTAYVKYLAPHDAAIFTEFLFMAVNYSGSFLLMHALGFKLATKQPSMTAAALAGKLKEEGGQADDQAFVDEIARISRSQFAAVLGNLAAVIPMALIIDLLHRKVTGAPFFPVEKAHAFLNDINPAISATIPFATITGVLLFLSSMIAGWVENASVYGRVPDVLRTHPVLVWILGRERTARLSESYLRNVSGVVGSIALGVLLAATPMIGRFFGVPLAAHHVTLTTGAVTYSVAAIGWENMLTPVLVFAGIGIMTIGLLNFGVSFALALLVAVRARDLNTKRLRSIFRLAVGRLVRRPHEFLFPIGNAKENGAVSPETR